MSGNNSTLGDNVEHFTIAAVGTGHVAGKITVIPQD